MVDQVRIRDMQRDDVKHIIAIDKRIIGKERAPSWQQKVELYLETYPLKCLVAKVGDKVVGFLLGDIRGWEYGLPSSGWLEIVGVDPEYQGGGIGKKLVAAFVDYCRSGGVKSVYALIRDDDKRLAKFLRAAGLKRGHLVNFEQQV
jgi:ribosomal protein S18 acetylase RimI-like enzyme